MRLSASIIVKNEQACLPSCLESLKTVVDEIVVTDTGSTDGTVQIARGFADRVAFFPWCNDFAAAKNYSLDQTSGDYVLVVDADEQVIDPESASERLRHFVRSHTEKVAGIIQVRSTIGAGNDASEVIDKQPRFFCPRAYRYEGAIHEQLVAVAGFAEHLDTGVVLHHSGYEDEVAAAKGKFARNRAILEQELAFHPGDEYLRYQLGKTHFSVKDYGAATTCFEEALKCIDFRPGEMPQGVKGPVAPSVLMDLPVSLAYCYANLGRMEAALALLENHQSLAHPGILSADFDHALGYVHLMLGHVPEARAAYNGAIAKGPGAEQVVGTGSFSSLYHLGLLCEADHDLPGALSHYMGALKQRTSWRLAIERCIDLVTEYGVGLPAALLETCDEASFIEAYRERLRGYVTKQDSKKAALLIEAAGGLSAALLAACRQCLEQSEGEDL